MYLTVLRRMDHLISPYIRAVRGGVVVRAHASRAGRSTVRVRHDALTECSLTAHPAAYGHMVVTLGR